MIDFPGQTIEPVARDFVKFKCADFKPDIQRVSGYRLTDAQTPRLTIIIPTRDAYRGGYFPQLLGQLRRQSYQRFEVLIIKGDPRQGRAINIGAALARGEYILTLDDDTRLGHFELFDRLVNVLDEHSEIGMAGVPNLVPVDASTLVRLVMEQVPRRSSRMVEEITVSDMAEHPCLIMRKDIFFRVGGENELLPRGLDPYLRQVFREAGYKVVVIPEVFIHHLPPVKPDKLIRQFFRNGYIASYVNKFFPQWVFELTTEHRDLEQIRAGWNKRLMRQVRQISGALVDLKLILLITQLAYVYGFCWGLATIRSKDDL